jgi:predicted RNase H-like nuclease (RuvC/YqgF family)
MSAEVKRLQKKIDALDPKLNKVHIELQELWKKFQHTPNGVPEANILENKIREKEIEYDKLRSKVSEISRDIAKIEEYEYWR